MAIVDYIFPNSFLSCHSIQIDSQIFFCHDCWKELIFIQKPFCAICGIPFSYEEKGIEKSDILCLHCHKSKPAFDSARSLFIYNNTIKKPILMFKHHDQTQYAKSFGLLLKHYLEKENVAFDIIMPIPLHWVRLLKRQFNQSALMAKYIGKTMQKPVDFDALKKSRNTPSQEKKSRIERIINVEQAFCVKNPLTVLDKKILLIDDVMTTGSTLHEAAAVLKNAKAKEVHCLSIARSVPGYF
ncbi:MAG: hypothetical protein HEEMFOPI_00803 [Holosporales bacterium]